MQTHTDVQQWRGAKAVDANGDKVGTVDEVYLDRGSDQPEWLTVSTGLFGTRTTFVPVADADFRDGEVHLAYTKDQVKDAPNVDADGALSADEEQRLYEHYGRALTTVTGDARSGDDADDDLRPRHERAEHRRCDDALRGGAARRDDRARSRPRAAEEVRRRGRGHPDGARPPRGSPRRTRADHRRQPRRRSRRAWISEEEHEVTLHTEEAVVEKRAVPKERVRLETDVVTDEETVSDTVRKERIDTDADTRRR